MTGLREQAALDDGNISELWIAIGTEAGWTSTEQDDAQRNGWTPLEMGHTILRTSTAAVAAATLLSHWRLRSPRDNESAPA